VAADGDASREQREADEHTAAGMASGDGHDDDEQKGTSGGEETACGGLDAEPNCGCRGSAAARHTRERGTGHAEVYATPHPRGTGSRCKSA